MRIRRSSSAGAFARRLIRHRGLILPATVAAMVLVLLVPLPAAWMDVLLLATMAAAAVVLLAAIYAPSPLDFSALPTVLLGVTLFRLAVGVAAVRLILAGDDAGAGQALGDLGELGPAAAGQVIWAFSHFVARGSLTVGVVLLGILMVVQFAVMTKGAGRISEVAARFMLDAMPGKQMAVDADLAAGLIGAEEAMRRRQAIAREAELYAAMDGASKFLRGEAVAALLLVVICAAGGTYVGWAQRGWAISDSWSLSGRLAVGLGLAMQVPALLVSIAAALTVTRTAGRSNLGEDAAWQLLSRPVVPATAGVFLAALAFTPLPKLPLLLLAAGCLGTALVLSPRKGRPASPFGKAGGAETPDAGDAARPERPARAPEPPGQHLEHLLGVDVMRLELGYGLVRLVDPAQGGDLLDRIAALRRQMALELGLIVPPIRIQDNLGLDARGYVVRVRGAKVASGRLFPGQLLAVAGEKTAGKVVGHEATDPATGSPAAWISPSQQAEAERMNYSVIDPAGVLTAHLAEIIRRHAAEILSRQQVAELLENLKAAAPQLVAEVAATVKLGKLQKVLQNLLTERVPIRDLEAILEAAVEAAETTGDPDLMTLHVRARLGRALTQPYCDEGGRLWCVSLDPALEESIRAHLGVVGRAVAAAIPSELAQRVSVAAVTALAGLRKQGRRPVLVCRPDLRPAVRQLVAASMPDAVVLGYNEVESCDVQSIESVGVEW